MGKQAIELKYKYESKWRKYIFFPLLSSDSLSELRKFKYNIIQITETEWKSLQTQK